MCFQGVTLSVVFPALFCTYNVLLFLQNGLHIFITTYPVMFPLHQLEGDFGQMSGSGASFRDALDELWRE